MPVRVSGLAEILLSMNNLADESKVSAALKEAVHEGAALAKEAVLAETPERTDRWTEGSTSLKPGALREGLEQQDATSKAGNAYSVVKFNTETAPTARWVDKGHRLVKGGKSRLLKSGKISGKGREVGFVPGPGFFRRAVDGVEVEVKSAVRQSLKDALEKMKKG